jgi:hypothetical protein
MGQFLAQTAQALEVALHTSRFVLPEGFGAPSAGTILLLSPGSVTV